MIDCQNLKFSDYYSKQRLSLAYKIIGEKNVKKIIAFTLYLFGAGRKAVTDSVEIPYDTFKSFTERIEQEGLPAFFDRRIKHLPLLETKTTSTQEIKNIQVNIQDNYYFFNLESGCNLLKIPINNSMQVKTILLTLLDNNLISRNTVAELLDYSPVHIQRLNQKLKNNDVSLFIDQRQGQQKQHVFSPEIQTELFQQYISHLVTGRNVASRILSEALKQRCNIDLPARTIRYHLEKSGLTKIKRTLPELLESLKKNSKI
jgi:biotin operon repressor